MSYVSNPSSGGGGGSGTVTSITAGTGITLTPDPITTTGSVALTIPLNPTDTNGTIYYDGTQLLTVVPGTATWVLTSNGAGSAPTYQASTGGIVTLNGDAGSATGSVVTFDGSYVAGGTLSFIGVASTMSLRQSDPQQNVAVGYQTLISLAGGSQNSCFGQTAGLSITSGAGNSILGYSAGVDVADGINNSFFGQNAGAGVTSGNNNIGLGNNASNAIGNTTSDCISIGNVGIGDAVSGTIVIGTDLTHTRTFIAGITGVSITGNPVLIDPTTGQLGDTVSSKKFKENIKDMDDGSSIMKLRPVTFNMISDTKKKTQFGLIAEEVHDIFPEIVVYKNNEPYSVMYHMMPSLLLKEIQKLRKEVDELKSLKKE